MNKLGASFPCGKKVATALSPASQVAAHVLGYQTPPAPCTGTIEVPVRPAAVRSSKKTGISPHPVVNPLLAPALLAQLPSMMPLPSPSPAYCPLGWNP